MTRLHVCVGLNWSAPWRRMGQVERLSGMCELSPERLARMEERVRLQAINSSVNIGSRLRKLYELIEKRPAGAPAAVLQQHLALQGPAAPSTSPSGAIFATSPIPGH